MKATSKSARRRAKRHAGKLAAAAPMSELALKPIKRRPKGGRARQRQIEAQSDPTATALAARLRRIGLPDTTENRHLVNGPLHSDEVGYCIAALTTGDDRRHIETAWGHLQASWQGYCRRILSRQPTAQGATLPMLAEPVETDPSARVDLRSGDERDEAAKRSWANWSARIAALPKRMRIEINAALRGMAVGETIWRHRRPTPRGARIVQALREMVRDGG